MGDDARRLTLDASYEHCRRMARGSSFYPAFFLVDRERRRALWAIYAFNRRCDDLSDSKNASLEALAAWRSQLQQALQGRQAADPIWMAFAHAAARYEIPHQCFHDMIDGVSSDLTQKTRETFDDVYRYCYQVASVVGISVASIFGARGEEARRLAEKNGVAVQLTNILRDVEEDLALGRIYLAQQDMRAYGVREVADSAEMRALLAEYGRRARTLFDEGRPLLKMVAPETRSCLLGMLGVYARLLDKIEARKFDVFHGRIRLSKAEKMGVLARALLAR